MDNRCDAAEGGAGDAETGKVRAVVAGEREEDHADADQCAERRQAEVTKNRENAGKEEKRDAGQDAAG